MLYTKYRPITLDEVVGQQQHILTLQNQIKKGEYNHAYLFAGHRGCGKTTLARILARTICCEHPTEKGPCNSCENCNSILKGKSMDLLELDAASNNSIDNIKDLVASTNYHPTLLPKKIYIIDEVHSLSGSAFNALLKTLEEPPAHCIFILCTTELHKIPATIKSRCSIFQFKALPVEAIKERLSFVLKELSKPFDEEALNLIAKQSDGSMRDALSILEQLIISCERLTAEHVKKSLCLMNDDIVLSLLNFFQAKDGKSAVQFLNQLWEEGKNLSQLVDDLIQCITEAVVLKSSEGKAEIFQTDEYRDHLIKLTHKCRSSLLFWYIQQLGELRERIRNSLNPYMDVLLVLIKCCNPDLFDESEISLTERISFLEKKVENLWEKILSGSISETAQYQIQKAEKIYNAGDERNNSDFETVTDSVTENPFETKGNQNENFDYLSETEEAKLKEEEEKGGLLTSSDIDSIADDEGDTILGLLGGYL